MEWNINAKVEIEEREQCKDWKRRPTKINIEIKIEKNEKTEENK